MRPGDTAPSRCHCYHNPSNFSTHATPPQGSLYLGQKNGRAQVGVSQAFCLRVFVKSQAGPRALLSGTVSLLWMVTSADPLMMRTSGRHSHNDAPASGGFSRLPDDGTLSHPKGRGYF